MCLDTAAPETDCNEFSFSIPNGEDVLAAIKAQHAAMRYSPTVVFVHPDNVHINRIPRKKKKAMKKAGYRGVYKWITIK